MLSHDAKASLLVRLPACSKSPSLGFGRRVPRHIEASGPDYHQHSSPSFLEAFAPDNAFLLLDLSVHGIIHIPLPLLSYLQHHRAFRDPISSTTYIPDRQAGLQRWVVGELSSAPNGPRTDKVATAIDRISAVAGQLSSPKQGKARLLEKNPDDVSPPTFSYCLPTRLLALSLHLLTRPPLLLL